MSFQSTNEHLEDSCCKEDLTENESMFIEKCFDQVCNLTYVERSTVTYIAGYITRKEFGKKREPPNHKINPNFESDCEFLNLVSRGKLSLPLASVHELSLYCYIYNKIVENKTCQKIT